MAPVERMDTISDQVATAKMKKRAQNQSSENQGVVAVGTEEARGRLASSATANAVGAELPTHTASP